MPGIRNKSHNEMMNILNQFCMNSMGFGPVAEIRMLTNGSGAGYLYYRDKINEANFHTSIYKAYTAAVTARNDVILVTPESHAWKGDTDAGGEALTWSKTSTHLLGLSPTSLAGYNRARLSHAGYTMANFMTVSGADNCFKNLRFMHGSATGGASDLTCLTVSGAGNRFENVAFAGPNDETQGAAAAYLGVVVSGTQNYFKNCMFGSYNSVLRTVANAVLNFPATAGPGNIFENCIFRSAIGATTPYFIADACTAATSDDFTGIFLNCQFINQPSAYTMTLGINKTSNTHRYLFFDNRCTFAGVADIVAAAVETQVIWGGAGSAPDTVLGNNVSLGLAQNPNHTV